MGDMFDQMAANKGQVPASPSVSIPQPVAPVATDQQPAGNSVNIGGQTYVSHGVTQAQADAATQPPQAAAEGAPDMFDQMSDQQKQKDEQARKDTLNSDDHEGMMARMFHKAVVGVGSLVPESATGPMAKFRDIKDHVDNEVINAFTEAGAEPAKAAEALKNLREKGLFNWNIENAMMTGGFIPPGADIPQNPSDKEFEEMTAKDFPHLYGAGRGTGAIVGSLFTPENLAIMAVMPEAKAYPLLSKLISTTFAAQMSAGSIQEIKNVAANWGTMSPAERSEALTKAVEGTALAAGAVVHAGSEIKGEAKPSTQAPTPAPAVEPTDKRTTLRPTTKTTAGVSAPISAIQQENPSFFTKAVGTNLATQAKASAFQEEMTKPAARRQAVSVLSQVADDKINAHDALVRGVKAPDLLAGTDTPGSHETPDEIWKSMQDAANQTYDLARDISKREQTEWQKERDAAEAAHRAELDRHNAAVAEHNADPDNKENPLEPIKFNPDDLNVRERPKTYDELKSDLDMANDRMGRLNPTDVRERAKTVDVPKAEKALDDWFKNHEEDIPRAEYNSAKNLWADSLRFKDIANNIRGKLAKGTLTGNDIRGLGAVVDNKAIRQRGQAGIGTFKRLVGDEAANHLEDVAKLFDPLDKSDPRYAMIKSWGGYAAKYVVGYMLAPMLGIPTWAAEGGALLTQYFMNKVMFDPEFGKSFGSFADGVRRAIETGVTMSADAYKAFRDKLSDLAEKYKNSRAGSETGAVGAAVRPRRTGPGAGSKVLNPEQAPKDESTREYKDVGNGVHQVLTHDAQGQAQGQLVAQDVEGNPNATRVKSHWVGDDVRGQGYGGKQIQHLAENLAAKGKTMLLSDTDMTDSAKGAWDKLAAQNPDAVRKAGNGYIYDLTKLKESENHIANAADEYNKSVNRPVLDQTKVGVDPNREQVADDFEAMKHDPNNPRVKASYEALKREIKQQWDFLTKEKGITIEGTDKDPYGFSGSDKPAEQQLFDDVIHNKHLKVWRGGNPLMEGHPLAEVDPETGENYNTMLRAIHDIMGHVAGRNDFSEKGEENAYNLHKQAFSDEARPAMTTETKGQTSWFFNNKGVREGAPLGQFAEQKAGLLPEFQNQHDVVPSEDLATYHNKNRGFTLNGREGFMRGKPGFSVAGEHPELDQIIPGQNLKPEQIEAYRNRPDVKAVLQNPNYSIGGWFHKGNTHLEVSKLMQDRDAAVAEGKRLNQVSVFDHENKAEIPTGGTGTPVNQMAGTMAGAIADTAFLQQAKAENPEGTVSQWLQRAQALKEAANTANAVKSEITTRRPTAVKADMSNVAGQASNMDAVNQADRNNPSGQTAAGKTKLGYKTKLARTVATYPGMELEPEELAKMTPDQVINKFVSHVSDNLEWMWNQIPPEIRDQTRKWYDAANGVMKTMAQKYGYSPEQAAGVTAATSPQNPWDNNLGLSNRIMDIYRNRQNQPFTPEMEQKAAELKKVPTQSKAFKGLLKDIAGKKLGEVKSENGDVQAVQRALWIRLYDEAHGAANNDQYAPTGEVVGLSPDTRSWIGLDHLAKAVKILDNGSVDNINNVMGQGHKIRNFYNNLISPMSKGGHTTIDTHAVAAGLLLPVGAKDLEAAHNFGGTLKGVPGPPKDASTGLQGTYPLFTEAYQRAARKLGILPRELQSVTWEGVKSLMGDEKKTPELKAQVKDLWHEVAEGKLTAAEARAKIKSAANGFSKPAWMSEEQWEKLGPEGADTGFNPEEF